MTRLMRRRLAVRMGLFALQGVSISLLVASAAWSQQLITVPEGKFAALTEPPCSYCSTQDRKGLILDNDRVLSWIRGAHNGGAIPLRHFLSGPRVINDTYGLFFYDPNGAYVAAYKKDYGYTLHGWKNGLMIIRGRDGTLWSALSGRAISGPQEGARLERVPSFVSTWEYWNTLHPESTAYDLFDGQRYPIVPLPAEMDREASESMGKVDPRLAAEALVLGVDLEHAHKAYLLTGLPERATYSDTLDETPITVFWYAATETSVAFDRRVEGRTLTFYADEISPESAPFKDRETGTRWTLAGRAVDGPLRGKELTWIPSIQCRWFAWSAEFPETELTKDADE